MTFYPTKTHIGHGIMTGTYESHAFETLRLYCVQHAQYDRDLNWNCTRFFRAPLYKTALSPYW